MTLKAEKNNLITRYSHRYFSKAKPSEFISTDVKTSHNFGARSQYLCFFAICRYTLFALE